MKRAKIAIIGAGPAGLFAAQELASLAQITIYDKGREISKRKCPRKERNIACIDCVPCNVHNGIGGAGLMSDGKLIFHTQVGSNLSGSIREKVTKGLISTEENQTLIDQVEKRFRELGIHTIEQDEEKAKEIKKRALQCGDIEFIYTKQAHIGSDKLPTLMKQIQVELLDWGVNFVPNKEIKTLDEIDYDFVILAPGRGGAIWLESVLQKQNIQYGYRPVDIGIRVEVQREITDDITNVTRDMKFYTRSKTFDDVVRTFCVCPGGFVGQETHNLGPDKQFILVNGEAESEKMSENTNFALLTTVPLRDSNTNIYAALVAQLGYAVRDGNKITVQRLGDLKRGRKSKADSQYKYSLQPTLKEAEWGDISLALPGRHYINCQEGLEELNKLIPGLTNNTTLIYAPEEKFHGLRIKTDKHLQAAPDMYVAGDGAGVSRGIVGAAVSGLLVAKGIRNKIQRSKIFTSKSRKR